VQRLQDRIRRPAGSSPAVVAAAVAIGLVAALLAAGLTITGNADVAIHPAAMAVLLTLISLPLIRWVSDGNRTVQLIACAGLVAKGAGTYARIRFNRTGADAGYYHIAGQHMAELLTGGFVGPDDPRLLSRGTGTNHLTYLVGWLYHYAGPRIVTAYVVWSFIAFLGMLCFYKAACIAVPELDRSRYAILLFLLPSMLFWPSSLGKDAVMVGSIGLAALGASTIAVHRYSVRGLAALAAGLGLAAWVRPHVAALMIAALAGSLVWPRRTGGGVVRQIVTATALFVVLAYALGQSAEYFGAERFEVTTLLDFAADRTAEGGSEFTPVRVSGPASFALAVVTVLLRPLPFEVSSSTQFLSSLEGVGLVVLAAVSFARLRTLPRMFLERAYVRMCVIYTLGFIMAFSVISNFGILARQRAQLWPLLLVLLALPTRGELVVGRSAALSLAEPDGQSASLPDQPTRTGSESSDLYVP